MTYYLACWILCCSMLNFDNLRCVQEMEVEEVEEVVGVKKKKKQLLDSKD